MVTCGPRSWRTNVHTQLRSEKAPTSNAPVSGPPAVPFLNRRQIAGSAVPQAGKFEHPAFNRQAFAALRSAALVSERPTLPIKRPTFDVRQHGGADRVARRRSPLDQPNDRSLRDHREAG